MYEIDVIPQNSATEAQLRRLSDTENIIERRQSPNREHGASADQDGFIVSEVMKALSHKSSKTARRESAQEKTTRHHRRKQHSSHLEHIRDHYSEEDIRYGISMLKDALASPSESTAYITSDEGSTCSDSAHYGVQSDASTESLRGRYSASSHMTAKASRYSVPMSQMSGTDASSQYTLSSSYLADTSLQYSESNIDGDEKSTVASSVALTGDAPNNDRNMSPSDSYSKDRRFEMCDQFPGTKPSKRRPHPKRGSSEKPCAQKSALRNEQAHPVSNDRTYEMSDRFPNRKPTKGRWDGDNTSTPSLLKSAIRNNKVNPSSLVKKARFADDSDIDSVRSDLTSVKSNGPQYSLVSAKSADQCGDMCYWDEFTVGDSAYSSAIDELLEEDYYQDDMSRAISVDRSNLSDSSFWRDDMSVSSLEVLANHLLCLEHDYPVNRRADSRRQAAAAETGHVQAGIQEQGIHKSDSTKAMIKYRPESSSVGAYWSDDRSVGSLEMLATHLLCLDQDRVVASDWVT